VTKKCEHGRQRSRCNECGGTTQEWKNCPHGRQRCRCKDCKVLGVGGEDICEHEHQRSRCVNCGGNGTCEHHKQRRFCKECKGSGFCRHDRSREHCSICRPEALYKHYKRNARKRGHAFTLTPDEFESIVAQPCFFCGESEQPRGIDRWDNQIGYELLNRRPCCGPHNRFKGALNASDFIELCMSVADHVRAVEASNDAFFQQDQTV
jgi:hypothetical protein